MTYQEVVARRLSGISSALFVLAIVAFSGLLYQIDAQDVYRDVEALTTLGLISWPKIKDSNEIIRDPKVVGPSLTDWLGHQYPDLNRKRIESQEEVIHRLKMDPNVIEELEGKGGAEATPFRLYELKPSTSISAGSGPLKQPFPAPGQQTNTVFSLIDKLADLYKPTNISIVTSLSNTEASVFTEDGIRWDVKSILLIDNVVSVDLREEIGVQQRPAAVKTIQLDAVTEAISGPTYLELYPFPEAERLAVTDLAANTARLDALGRRYGLFDIGQARGLAEQALAESYKSISVLGFNFAPRHLPVVILVLSGAILAFAIYTIEQMRRKGMKLTETDSDSLLYPFIQNRWGRCLVWACLPPISVLIALPFALITQWGLIAFFALIFWLTGLGVICSRRAAGVFTETE